MKQILFILCVLALLINMARAQTKTSMSMPDVNRLMKMTPAERERYADSMTKAASQQAIKMADQYGLAIDETVLPGVDIKPPVKDVARLALIPSRPPTRTELVQQIQKSQEQLQTVMPKPEVIEIEKFSAQKSLAQLHQASLTNFYNNQPEKALLMMLNVARQQPDSVVVLNNLGAMLNMVGLPHRAVSILQYCLQQEGNSSVILNNIAQSYMGLGDLVKARQYFMDCLALDSLNPEANRALGMMNMYDKKFDEAIACFNRELMVAMRSSTMAYAVKMGKKINLRELQKIRNRLNGRPQKDHFEEIHLGKFKIPSFPVTAAEAYAQVPDFLDLSTSIGTEMLHWMTLKPSAKQMELEGKSKPGLYSSLVKALLQELDKEFTPQYLSNITDRDVQTGMEIINKYAQELRNVKCPQPPPGSTFEVQQAYEIKCCKEREQPITDRRIAEYGNFWYGKVKVAQQRWKSYLNQMIEIVQLDPSTGNQLMVYKAVGGYFSFLASSLLFSGTAEAANKALPLCNINYSVAQADSVITANRNWELACPSWLNIELDLGFGKIKADCAKYGLEIGEGIIGQYEYDFKTGTSTLAAGMGVKAKFFAGIGKASIKQLVFVSFDNNNQFADWGLRSKAEVGIGDNPFNVGPIKVGGTLAGVEGTYDVAMNAGVTATVKGKGIFADL